MYQLARQRYQTVKDVQQVRVIKGRDGSVLALKMSTLSGGWMVERVNQEELMIRREEMRVAMMRTKSGKADGPDDIPGDV